MKLISITVALLTSLLPTIYALPADPLVQRFPLPTCAAESCLVEPPGLFDGCAPGDLGCLCTLELDEVVRYVHTVARCLDGVEGRSVCTEGAIFQYKDLLSTVCASDQFGSKIITWPASIVVSEEK